MRHTLFCIQTCPSTTPGTRGRRCGRSTGENLLTTINASLVTLQDWIPTITLSKHRAELYYLLMLLHTHHRNHEWLASRAIITPTNGAAEMVNSHVMNKFPRNDIIYQTVAVLMRSTYICTKSLTTSMTLFKMATKKCQWRP